MLTQASKRGCPVEPGFPSLCVIKRRHTDGECNGCPIGKLRKWVLLRSECQIEPNVRLLLFVPIEGGGCKIVLWGHLCVVMFRTGPRRILCCWTSYDLLPGPYISTLVPLAVPAAPSIVSLSHGHPLPWVNCVPFSPYSIWQYGNTVSRFLSWDLNSPCCVLAFQAAIKIQENCQNLVTVMSVLHVWQHHADCALWRQRSAV